MLDPIAALADKRMLPVLDNGEHVIEAAALALGLPDGAPGSVKPCAIESEGSEVGKAP